LGDDHWNFYCEKRNYLQGGPRLKYEGDLPRRRKNSRFYLAKCLSVLLNSFWYRGLSTGTSDDTSFSLFLPDPNFLPPMRMEFLIRDATKDDIPLLTKLIRDSFRDVALRFNLTYENCPTHPSHCTTEWIESALKKGINYYILERKNIPCGCVALEQAQPNVFYLERLSVLPQFRRNGFGEAMVSHGVNEAKKLGAHRVEIGIISDQTELKEWYKKFGFSVKSETRFEHLPFKVTFMLREL
jgi:N-acetylglutamate synthase-like GNAT family acetyltransferase